MDGFIIRLKANKYKKNFFCYLLSYLLDFDFQAAYF